MDISGLLEEHSDELVDLIKNQLNLNSDEVDRTLKSTQEAVGETVLSEVQKNGLGTLLNLFSDDDNSEDSNSILKDLGSQLLKSLLSNGISKSKAQGIKELVLPFIIKLISSKVGGKSDLLSGLLGNNGGLSKTNSIHSLKSTDVENSPKI